MRESRTLASWVIALFVTVMLLWVAAEALAPQPPAKNHLFEVFRDNSGIAYFEPVGRFAFGVIAVLVGLLIIIPMTRRAGAILGALLLLGLGAMVGQLMMLGIKVSVDAIGEAGVVTTNTDPSGLFYLVVGLAAASIALIFVHPGKADT